MKIKKIVIIAISFVLGAGVGFLWASRAFARLEISKEVDTAAVAAMEANTLAMLRLNDTNSAIEQLEMQMDGAICTLAAWDQYVGQKPDEKTRAWRNRLLTSVKVYRQSFPYKDDDTNMVALVNSFLAKIPGRSPTSTCKSDLCRLDDLRLEKLGLATNLVLTNAAPR
jgi:hypothetical protein